MMKIALACDHGGFELKEAIKAYLEKEGYESIDYGTYSLDSVDYPDYAYKAAKAVAKKTCDRGIVCCGTGIGVSIVANKVKGIRCALAHDLFSAKATREHNDSNVLALGGRVISVEQALEITKIWLETEFEGDRHIKRLEKISAIEKEEQNG